MSNMLTKEQVSQAKATIKSAEQFVSSGALAEKIKQTQNDGGAGIVLSRIDTKLAQVVNLADSLKSNEKGLNALPQGKEIGKDLAKVLDILKRRLKTTEIEKAVDGLTTTLTDIYNNLSLEYVVEEKSNKPITLKVGGQTLSFGMLWTLYDSDTLTSLEDVSVVKNETYLDDGNIVESVKRGHFDDVEMAIDAIDNRWSQYSQSDIREICKEYFASDIPDLVDSVDIYKNRDEFDELYVDEVVLSQVPKENRTIVESCFDYDAYWNKYAKYSFTDYGSGIIISNY